jgi:ribosomal protein S18 acetylase RimI-like enzyme
VAIIRYAVLSDIQRIINIDFITRMDSRRIPFIEKTVRSGTCCIIESNEKLAGYGIFDYSFYQYGFIEMLYLSPEFRRMGLGTQLMDHFEKLCTTEKIFTSTNQSNTPAQKLFVSMGYQPSGIIYNLDEGDPELMYMKWLNH